MEYLSRIIEQRRKRNGMIQLDLPEMELIMDKEGQVVDAQPADNSYPHTIIEMFMVEANEAVASLFDRFGIPFMRRIHPEPDSLSIKNLSRFIRICGLKIPRRLDRNAIQDLLKMVKGRPEAFAINITVLPMSSGVCGLPSGIKVSIALWKQCSGVSLVFLITSDIIFHI